MVGIKKIAHLFWLVKGVNWGKNMGTRCGVAILDGRTITCVLFLLAV